MYSTFVVGTDGSPTANAAVAKATELAEMCGASLHVVHGCGAPVAVADAIMAAPILVTPDQVRDLWRHWDEPEILWYGGSHLSFMREPAVWTAVDRMLANLGRD